MRPAALLVPALLLALPGCVGMLSETKEDVEAASSAAQDAAGAARDAAQAAREAGAFQNASGGDRANATANATFVNATQPAANATANATPTPRALPVTFTGQMGMGPTACPPLDQGCATTPLGGGPVFMTGAEGALVSFTLTLAWEAATPASGELTLEASTCDKEACAPVSATGPSPLVLAVDDAGLRGNMRIRVLPASPVPVAAVEDGTPVTITGELVLVDVPGADGFAGHDGA